MQKQEKVLKNIHKTVAATTLGVKKNDECYTGMQDIINELQYWASLNKFVGKRIICPCDWDITADEHIYSIEITYKDNDVEVVGNNVFKAVKSVVYDLWSDDEEPVITKINLTEDEIEPFLRDKLTCNFIRTLTQNARRWGIKSVTASGYNPATGRGVMFQDVDYSKYDICISNPPFSQFTEFMECLVDKIDFIVLAPFLNRISINVGLYLMLRKAYLGRNEQIHINFANPTIDNKFHTKVVCCDWITSFPEAQKERNANIKPSGVDYETYKDEYHVMVGMTMKDGTHPIKVPACQIPDNYAGWMFTDIGCLSKIDQDAFEWYSTHFHKYFNQINPSMNPFAHKLSNEMVKDAGNSGFHGYVIRRKKEQEV